MICKNQGPYSNQIRAHNRLNALKRVEEMWDKPLKELGKVDNPTETDETEDEKNELVILDDADN